jgi:hypothetical protein
MIGVRSAGRKELVALADGYRESTEAWGDLLPDAARRGMPRARRRRHGDGRRTAAAMATRRPGTGAAPCAPRSSRSATGRWDVVAVDVHVNTVASWAS